jgi:hypothetical protein
MLGRLTPSTWFFAAGFLLPTAVIVIGNHLKHEASAGAALDGAVSSFWFAGMFFAGAVLAALPRRRTGQAPGGAALRHALVGAIAGAALWGLLALFWSTSASDALRDRALLVNSSSMFGFGLLATLLATALRRTA